MYVKSVCSKTEFFVIFRLCMTRANLSRPVVEVLQQRASSRELPRGRPLNAPAGRSGPGVPLQSPEGVEVSLVVRVT